MTLRTVTRLVALPAVFFALAACEQEGPFEQAGEAVDEAITDTEQKLDDSSDSVADKVEETVDDTADSVEEGLNEVADEVDDVTSS